MHPYSRAFPAAEALVRELAPHCERIEIAGSLRRGAQVVKDIEIVALGATAEEPVPGSLWETQTFDRLEHVLETVSANRHRSIVRPKTERIANGKTRSPAWGPRYKKLWFTHGTTTLLVDLFQPQSECWGPVLAIRTGPADFVRLLVTQQIHGGAMPPGLRQHEGRLERSTGSNAGVTRLVWEPVDTPDEADWFAALGVPLWEPHERTEARLAAWLQQQGIAPPARTRSGEKAPYAEYARGVRPATC